MTTLIAVYTPEGCVGRCDAKCYNATGDKCECVCGGANHGVGVNKAVENTERYAELWKAEYEALHDEKPVFEVLRKPVQFELF